MQLVVKHLYGALMDIYKLNKNIRPIRQVYLSSKLSPYIPIYNIRIDTKAENKVTKAT